MNDGFQLQRNPFGQLVLTGLDGIAHVGVEPARAFPITAPHEGISMLSHGGHELAWIPDLSKLPEETRRLINEELEVREFMPKVLRITGVSGFATPCTWQVETDKGAIGFTLKAEDDIRRLAGSALLIVDSHGIQFLVRDRHSLDDASRRILERFL
jgi:hypothetical protein